MRFLKVLLASLIGFAVALTVTNSWADLQQVYATLLNPAGVKYLATTQDVLSSIDAQRIYICGGSTESSANSSCVYLNGNGGPSNGNAGIFSQTSGSLTLTGGSSGITIQSNGNTRWTVNSSGDLSNDSSNGGQFIFNKALKGIANDMGTLAGAGSTQTDAAAIAHIISRVTGANGTVGVKLPALSSVGVGTLLYIINSNTSSALKYYSNASGETIDGQSGTTANTLAAKLWATCLAYDASNWYCADSVIPF